MSLVDPTTSKLALCLELASGDDGWEQLVGSDENLDFSNSSAPSFKGAKKPGQTNSAICIRSYSWFPNIEADSLWELVSDTEQRVKWDERWVDAKIVERKESSLVVSMYTKKPPVPMVSARQLCVEIFNVKDGGGDGRHVNVHFSVEHEEVVARKGGMFGGGDVRANVFVWGDIIEKNPDGDGSKMTHVRSIDLGGNFPKAMIDKMASNIGKANYKQWIDIINKRLAGQI